MIIAVVDDDERQRKSLEDMLREWAKTQGHPLLLDSFEDGLPFLNSRRRYELVFLDIYMKELNGIETARRLRNTDPSCRIVYLTVSDDHRADAFQVHAFDYIEKPVSREELGRVMADVLRSAPGWQNRLLIPVGKTQIPVDLSSLRQVTSDRNYCNLHMDECMRVRISFASMERILSGDRRFLKINRGILVNMDYVLEIENHSCHMKNGDILPVNMRHVTTLRQELLHYQFELRNRLLAGGRHGTRRQ